MRPVLAHSLDVWALPVSDPAYSGALLDPSARALVAAPGPASESSNARVTTAA
ncbi:MAG: hypothetical protein ACHQNA_09070 [Acidimicrobiales bacterium]